MSIRNKQLIDFLRKLAQNTFQSMGKKKILSGGIGWGIMATDLMGQTDVTISSYGGDLFEGLAMADVVTSEGIAVQGFGVVASAATLALAASPKKTGTPNSRYLIHDPQSWAEGNSIAIQKTANELEAERLSLVSFYEKTLKIPKSEIETLMRDEKFIDAQEALRIGLIDAIEEFDGDASTLPKFGYNDWYYYNQVGAAIKNAYQKNGNHQEPQKPANQKQQPMKKPENTVEKMLNRIFRALNISAPQNLVLTAQDGSTLDFGDEVESQADIVVGTTATVNGEPATGTYTLTDGTVLTFQAGAVTAITPPATEASTDANATNEALQAAQAQIENLQNANIAALAEKAAFEARAIKAESKLNQVEARLAAIDAKLAQNSKEYGQNEPNSPSGSEPRTEHKFLKPKK